MNDEAEWSAEITIYRHGVQQGYADVSAETFDDLTHQATSEMADFKRRELFYD